MVFSLLILPLIPVQYNHPIEPLFTPLSLLLPSTAHPTTILFFHLPFRPLCNRPYATHSFSIPFPIFFLPLLNLAPPSLAITDATPRALPTVAQMLICPLFFTAPETSKNLESKSYKQNPGRRDPPSWCSPGQRFADFETAGHTLLHEMTHLDAVGAAAGLSPRG